MLTEKSKNCVLLSPFDAKMFTIAGPVITFGLTASVVYGLILCLLQ